MAGEGRGRVRDGTARRVADCLGGRAAACRHPFPFVHLSSLCGGGEPHSRPLLLGLLQMMPSPFTPSSSTRGLPVLPCSVPIPPLYAWLYTWSNCPVLLCPALSCPASLIWSVGYTWSAYPITYPVLTRRERVTKTQKDGKRGLLRLHKKCYKVNETHKHTKESKQVITHNQTISWELERRDAKGKEETREGERERVVREGRKRIEVTKG